jgi:hypothetical protein
MRRPIPITIASRRGWNRLVDFYFRHRLLSVTVIPASLWRHPWYTALMWDAEGEAWTYAVAPGWCESPTGDPSPTVSTIARLAPTSAAALETDDRDAAITARIDESPRIPIDQDLWRAEGTDAVVLSGSEVTALPPAIAAMGVLGPTALIETGSGLVRQIEGVVADRARARLARACELYLEHGRETAAIYPVEVGGRITFDVLFRPAPVPAPRLALRRERIDPLAPRPRWVADDSGIVADEGIDRLHLATLWLVSPAGEPEGSEPDGRWTPYLEHRVDRNVTYEIEGPELRAVPPLNLNVPGRDLAGGVGRALIDLFAGDLQAQADALDASLAGTRTTGGFVKF